MPGRYFAAMGVLAVFGAACAAQSAPHPVPLFRASTRLVQINVIVDGKSGPVTGLSADDFVVTDNGRRQPIRVFSADSAVALAGTAPEASHSPPAAAPGVFTNTHERVHTMVVVLLDSLNAPDEDERSAGQPTWRSSHAFEFAKQRATMFLKQVDPDMSVALYGLGENLTILSDFSTDRGQLLAALRAYHSAAAADSGAAAPTDVPGEFNARLADATAGFAAQLASEQRQITMAALRAIANHLAQFPGRISLVWIMSSPPLPGAVVAAALGRDNIAVYTVDARGLQAREAVEAVSGNDHPDQGLSIRAAVMRLETQPSGLDRLQDIARQTGGRAFINTNDIAGAIKAAAADSAFSYTLGFYVDAKALDSRFHQLKVKVLHPGMQARYPHGYWALAYSTSSPQYRQATLEAALRSPLDSTAIPLHASISRAGTAATNALLVSSAVDIHNLRLEQSGGRRTGSLIIEVATQGVTGAVVQYYSVTVALHLTERQYASALQSGLQLKQTVQPGAGAVTLRILAEDPNSGAVGSLIVPLASIR